MLHLWSVQKHENDRGLEMAERPAIEGVFEIAWISEQGRELHTIGVAEGVFHPHWNMKESAYFVGQLGEAAFLFALRWMTDGSSHRRLHFRSLIDDGAVTGTFAPCCLDFEDETVGLVGSGPVHGPMWRDG